MEILVHRTHRAVHAVLLGHDLSKKDCLALTLVLDRFVQHHREKIQVCPLTVSDLVPWKATRRTIRNHVKGLSEKKKCDPLPLHCQNLSISYMMLFNIGK